MLLEQIYYKYVDLLKAWNHACDEREDAGALVFLLEAYSQSESFDQVCHQYWTTPEIRSYLSAGGESDEGYLDLLFDLDFGEEFMVMIVEFLEDETKHAVHIHKITRVGLN